MLRTQSRTEGGVCARSASPQLTLQFREHLYGAWVINFELCAPLHRAVRGVIEFARHANPVEASVLYTLS